jgi:putative intracellular protease/amidase
MALLCCAGFGVWLHFLPLAPMRIEAPAVPADEAAATRVALQPLQPGRPVIAILGANGPTKTEMTDYIMPYGILRRAEVADVIALSTMPGPVELYPALRVQADATIAEFDTRYPAGANYVIVPAMSRDNDPAVLRWLRTQRGKGANIIAICAGAKVVAAAGLLEGKRATTHWYYRKELLKVHPGIHFVCDRRFVVDGKVASTTGITASMPMSLTLIEAIAGKERAETVAHELAAGRWDESHASDAFVLSRPFASTVLKNSVAFWNHETFNIRLMSGVDEVSLALVADAWSRTYRSRVRSTSSESGPVISRNGLKIYPDSTLQATDPHEIRTQELPAVEALEKSLADIEERYGAATGYVVAAQLEYSGTSSP